jgi:hypothetical protein
LLFGTIHFNERKLPSLLRGIQLYISIRVTRRVWLKTAQNAALSVCFQNKCIIITAEKNQPKVWATYVNFKNLPKINNHPLGENSPNLVTLLGTQRLCSVTVLKAIATDERNVGR